MSFFCPKLTEKFSTFSASEIYEFLKVFESHVQFREFARTGLGLSEAVVNDIEEEEKNCIEQRFRMMRKWVIQNGQEATKKKAFEQYGKFMQPQSEEDDVSPQQESSPDLNPSYSQNLAPILSKNSAAEKQPLGSNQTNDQQQNEISSEAAYQGSTMCDGSSTLNVELCTEADIQLINKRHDNIYLMKHKRGLVVILNNNFTGDNLRKGAKEDVSDMEQLWTKFGCKIIIKEDKEASEMKKILEDIAGDKDKGITDGEKFNYLAVFVMSHGGLKDDGGEEIVLGNDDKPVFVDKDIKYQFSNEKSEYWIKIPKLFFFQFCYGTNLDVGCRLVDSDNIDPYSSTQATHCSYSDMFISYATLSEFTALRDTQSGSWFITAIRNVFMKYARIEHVAELMTRVCDAVSSKIGRVKNKRDGITIEYKAIGESHDMLSRILYLQPGRPSDDFTVKAFNS